MKRRTGLVFVAALLAVSCAAVWAQRSDHVRTTAPQITSTSSSTPTSSSTSTSTSLPATTTTSPAATTQATGPPAAEASPVLTTDPSPARPARVGIAGAVVVVDPGHNESNYAHAAEINQQVDIGTGSKSCDTTGTATNDGYSEAAYNTDVAARVRDLLVADGAAVVFTRDGSTPWGPCIDERARIGNAAHADAVVSIHADGGPEGGRGFHVIEPASIGRNESIVAPSHALALAMRSAYEQATGMPRSTYLGVDGLSTRSDLGGLNLSTVPKVFIETGNMRNATDAALFSDDAFRQRAAEGIVAGIEHYLTGG